MKLYYAETLNPRKVCALAKYLNSPVTFVPVELQKGEHRKPPYTSLNPNARVPTLVDGDTTLWESDAILCYLARAAGSDLWPSDDRQIEIMRWLSWSAVHFTRHGGTLYFEHLIKPAFGLGNPNPDAVKEATAYFMRSGHVLNEHLRGRKYLLGDAISIADFSVAISLPYAAEANIPLGEFPEIQRWHERLNELPAWREPFPDRQPTAA